MIVGWSITDHMRAEQLVSDGADTDWSASKAAAPLRKARDHYRRLLP